PTIDKLIKSQINFELHGLMDCAVDIAHHFRERLTPRLDVDHAIMLLSQRPPHARETRDITNCQDVIAALRKRITEVEQDHRTFEKRLTEAEQDRTTLERRLSDAGQDHATLEAKLTSVRFLLETLRRELAKRIGLHRAD